MIVCIFFFDKWQLKKIKRNLTKTTPNQKSQQQDLFVKIVGINCFVICSIIQITAKLIYFISWFFIF